MADNDFEIILKGLQDQYQGRFLVGVKEVAQIFDVSEKYVYNQTSRKSPKKFPVQPAAVPGKKFKLVDIARALAGV